MPFPRNEGGDIRPTYRAPRNDRGVRLPPNGAPWPASAPRPPRPEPRSRPGLGARHRRVRSSIRVTCRRTAGPRPSSPARSGRSCAPAAIPCRPTSRRRTIGTARGCPQEPRAASRSRVSRRSARSGSAARRAPTRPRWWRPSTSRSRRRPAPNWRYASVPSPPHLDALPKRSRWRPALITPNTLRHVRTTALGSMPGWCPPGRPIGPWRPVEVIEARGAIRVDSVRLAARHTAPGGSLAVTVHVRTRARRYPAIASDRLCGWHPRRSAPDREGRLAGSSRPRRGHALVAAHAWHAGACTPVTLDVR